MSASNYLPEGHLVLLCSRNDLEDVLAKWLKKGRDIEYFALIREIEIRLASILGAKPPPLTMRQLVAAALELDRSFLALVANDIGEDCRQMEAWNQVLQACAGTVLALYEEAKAKP